MRTAEELETVGCQHYQRFFSSPEANDDLLHGPDAHARGAVELLRGYFWIKSGDWGAATTPTALSGWNAKALQKLPEYYVLRGGRTMAATIAKAVKEGEGVADIEALALEPKLSFLTPDEVGVYAREFQRTGFQGGLDWFVGSLRRFFLFFFLWFGFLLFGARFVLHPDANAGCCTSTTLCIVVEARPKHNLALRIPLKLPSPPTLSPLVPEHIKTREMSNAECQFLTLSKILTCVDSFCNEGIARIVRILAATTR